MNILFLVPARSGSKGIPNKNLVNLAGCPLLAFSIMAIRKALISIKNLNTKIIVSTDSKKIAEVAKFWGAEVPFLRPEELANDKSDIIDTILYTVKELKLRKIFEPDIIFLIQPTSPLIEAKNILEALNLFLETKKPVISIAELEIPINWIFCLKDNKLEINKKVAHFRQKQKEKYYRPNGAIYISSIEDLKKNKSFYAENTISYFMEYYQSIDIDYPEDLEVAQQMLEYRNKLNLKEIKIGNKKIGKNNPVFFIAEAGVNHNGNLEIAKKLIDIAVDSGANCIKFQTFKAENLLSKNAKKADYQLKTTPVNETQYEMIKKLELSEADFIEVKNYCDKRKIMFLSTPFDLESFEFLKKLNVDAFKVSSGDLTNYFLIKEIAKTKKPVILSTGMSYLYEVYNAINLIEEMGNEKIAILHCLTEYPAPVEELNLSVIRNMKLVFNYPVGFSDHTEGELASIASIPFGVSIIEKHFTLDKNLPGPDHKASLDPEELKNLIKNIRKVENSIGNGIKNPAKSEMKNRKLVRRSLFSKCEIKKGVVIEENFFEALRPGNGISPMEIKKLTGKKTKRLLKIGDIIKFKDLEEL